MFEKQSAKRLTDFPSDPDVPLSWNSLSTAEWTLRCIVDVSWWLWWCPNNSSTAAITLICPSGHMTSITPVHPGEGSSSVALLKGSSLFFPVKGCLGVVPDPMWGQRSGMSMCPDCKALWDTFVNCENGLYWIELNESSGQKCNFFKIPMYLMICFNAGGHGQHDICYKSAFHHREHVRKLTLARRSKPSCAAASHCYYLVFYMI